MSSLIESRPFISNYIMVGLTVYVLGIGLELYIIYRVGYKKKILIGDKLASHFSEVLKLRYKLHTVLYNLKTKLVSYHNSL